MKKFGVPPKNKDLVLEFKLLGCRFSFKLSCAKTNAFSILGFNIDIYPEMLIVISSNFLNAGIQIILSKD
jgi:hypothetical protein